MMLRSGSLQTRLLVMVGVCWLFLSALMSQPANAAASISITKMASVSTAKVGEDIDYFITIKNTGTVKLTDITVCDPLLGGTLYCFPNCLEPCQSVTKEFDYEVYASDIENDKITNKATVTAFYGSKLLSASATTTVSVPDKDDGPAIMITKDVEQEAAMAGDILVYTIKIKNIGNKPLKNIVVTDSLINCGKALTGFPTTLDVGKASKEISFKYLVKACDPSDLFNTVTVNAIAGSGATATRVTAWGKEFVRIVHPSIEIVKAVDPECAQVGDIVKYILVIRNTGDVKLDNIFVKDTLLDYITGCPLPGFPFCLEPGESSGPVEFFYCVDPADVVDGQIINMAEVHAQFFNGECLEGNIADRDFATLCVFEPKPEISVCKKAEVCNPTVGSTVNYTITIKNTGDFDLYGVTVDDSLLGDLTDLFFPDDPLAFLPVGSDPITVTVPYVIKSTDTSPLTNEVDVSAIVSELDEEDDYEGSGLDGRKKDDIPLVICAKATATVTFTSSCDSGNGTTTGTQALPDMMVYDNAYSNRVGWHLYGANGNNQSKTQSTAKGSTITFPIRLENDTNTTSCILISATVVGGSGWKVEFRNAKNGGSDITSQVMGSGWNCAANNTSMAANAARDFILTVNPSSSGCKSGDTVTVLVTAKVQGTTKSDTIKAIVVVK